MVWLFSVIAVSNIAMGYGLAVYFHQNFGTAVPSRGTLRKKKVAPPSADPVVVETPTVDPSVATELPAPAVAENPKAESVADVPSTAPTEEVGGLPPVDEQNVLAGIEEFRSQLAKMNVTAEEDAAESVTDEAEAELAGAAN